MKALLLAVSVVFLAVALTGCETTGGARVHGEVYVTPSPGTYYYDDNDGLHRRHHKHDWKHDRKIVIVPVPVQQPPRHDGLPPRLDNNRPPRFDRPPQINNRPPRNDAPRHVGPPPVMPPRPMPMAPRHR